MSHHEGGATETSADLSKLPPHVLRCMAKNRHKTYSDGLVAASEALRREDIEVDTLRVYKCGVCGGYHLTSQPYRTKEQLDAYHGQMLAEQKRDALILQGLIPDFTIMDTSFNTSTETLERPETPLEIIRSQGAAILCAPQSEKVADEQPTKVWIPIRSDGHIADVDSFNAFMGFTRLNDEAIRQGRGEPYKFWFYHTHYFCTDRNDIFIGSVNSCRTVLKQMGSRQPPALDYPDSLKHYLGRDIGEAVVGDLMNGTEKVDFPLFVKPKRAKLFNGTVIQSFMDWEGLLHMDGAEVYVSEIIQPLCEWRYFVLNGEVQGAKQYAGSYDIRPPRLEEVRWAIADYEKSGEAPVAYAIDFARLKDGINVLIEVNDCYALGSYDLDAKVYARMLEARWRQLTSDIEGGEPR